MILVTGASKGLGNAIYKRLTEKGLSVYGLARNIDNLKSNSFKCDVTSYLELKKVANRIKKSGETISVLINSAGIASMNLALITPENVTRKIIETNLLGTIFCCQLFGPLLIRNKKGNIINFSTVAVPIGLAGESVYVASKAGVEGFTKSFAREMSKFNITVNCIAPGPIDTDLTKGVPQPLISEIIKRQIIQKKFSPNDICDLVEILIDNRVNSISGQTFYVGGI